jgi:hypothetical protein
VIAQIRSVGPVTTVTEPGSVTVPLTGGTWTQHAEEPNEIVGQFTATGPLSANCGNGRVGGGFPNRGWIEILVDGREVSGLPAGDAGALETTEIVALPVLATAFEPGKDTPHTLTAQASDECGTNGGNTGGHVTIDSVSIDVIGIH